MDEIEKILRKIRPDVDFGGSRHFLKDQLIDSLDLVEIVMTLEGHFGIDIPESCIVPDNFLSFEAIRKLVDDVKRGRVS